VSPDPTLQRESTSKDLECGPSVRVPEFIATIRCKSTHGRRSLTSEVESSGGKVSSVEQELPNARRPEFI
jgi:hypothetical protein